MARSTDQLTKIVADALLDGKRGQTGAGGRIIKSVVVNANLVAATLDTGVEGNDNAITWTAVNAGTGGNSITVALIDPPGNNAVLGVVVTDTDIVVNLATDGASAITSTAADVIEAIEADEDASALVTVANKGASDGTGVVTAVAETPLANGANNADTITVKFYDEGTLVTKTLTLT